MPFSSRRAAPLLLGSMLALAAQAQSTDKADTPYPERAVTLVMPFPAGAMGDTLARILAEQMSKEWKQPVVVDNRAGASGMIGNQYVARAAPDGYTLLLGISQLVQAPALYSKIQYDVQKDFVPLRRIANAVSVFATTDPQIKSVKDYATLAAASPDKYSYGTFGNGTSSHIYAEIFNKYNKIEATQIPYKGSAPLLNDMMAGHVKVSFSDLATALPFIKDGKVRAYAVNGTKRSAVLPDVPTFKELGYPGLDVVGWYGTFAPAKTPQPVIDKITRTLDRILRMPEVQAKLSGFGLEPASGAPEDFAQRIETDLAFWKRAISAHNIKVEQ